MVFILLAVVVQAAQVQSLGLSGGPGTRQTERPAVSQEADAQLRETVRSAPPENLAGAYLTNENTLELIGLAGITNVNFFLGGVRVTADNIKSLQADHERRRDIYSAGILSRGFTQIAGRYSAQGQEGQPCAATKEAPYIVELKQQSFKIELFPPGAANDDAIPGVVVEKTLVTGEGEFSPDNYMIGVIAGDRITVRLFSGSGCPTVLTRQ